MATFGSREHERQCRRTKGEDQGQPIWCTIQTRALGGKSEHLLGTYLHDQRKSIPLVVVGWSDADVRNGERFALSDDIWIERLEERIAKNIAKSRSRVWVADLQVPSVPRLSVWPKHLFTYRSCIGARFFGSLHSA